MSAGGSAGTAAVRVRRASAMATASGPTMITVYRPASLARSGSGPTSVELSRSAACRGWTALRAPLTDLFGIIPGWLSASSHRPALARCASVRPGTRPIRRWTRSAISESDRSGQHILRPSGPMVGIRCVRGTLEAIEPGRPSSRTDRALFQGVDVFALPAREVVRRVGGFASIEEDPDDASFVAPDLLPGFRRPFRPTMRRRRSGAATSARSCRHGLVTTAPPLRRQSDSGRARDCPVRMPAGHVSAGGRSRPGRPSGT
ncbi:hypothetical protein SUDANB6_00197 [Streptomyces sp. enrichment culture]